MGTATLCRTVLRPKTKKGLEPGPSLFRGKSGADSVSTEVVAGPLEGFAKVSGDPMNCFALLLHGLAEIGGKYSRVWWVNSDANFLQAVDCCTMPW